MEIKLINKDVFSVLPFMESASVDITFTSVPFKPEDMGLTKGEYWKQMDCLYRELLRITSKAIFIIQSASNMQEYIRRYDPIRIMIWGKGQVIMSNARYNPIFVHQILICINIILESAVAISILSAISLLIILIFRLVYSKLKSRFPQLPAVLFITFVLLMVVATSFIKFMVKG